MKELKILLTSPGISKGFTLLELLLALSLSTLVMLILAMGMNTVLNEWTRAGNHLDDSLDRVLVLLQLERALQGAYPHTYLDQDENKKYIFFIGEKEQLTWVSTVSPGRQPGLTAWQILPNEKEDSIEIRITPAFANDPSERLEKEEASMRETVLKDYQVSFEYLYVDEQITEDTKWVDKWSGKELQGLPNAVRARFEHQQDSRQSVEIIAMILANEHQTIRRKKPD
jgi:general secretion pathway protein J